MDRERLLVALAAGAAVSLWVASPLSAQVPAQEPGGGGGPNVARPLPPPQQLQGSQQRFAPRARERWRSMSPEDRQRVRSNAERWLQMQPEEQKFLREKEGFRRQRLRRESEEALQKSGLQLEAERREAWERQYLQERRRIERALRQELEEKRQRELAPVVERLKKEFSQGSGPGGSATASPKK